MTPDRIQRSRAVVLMALMLTVPVYAADTKPLDNLLAQQAAADKAAKGAQEQIDKMDDGTQQMLNKYRRTLEDTQSITKYNAHLTEQVVAQRTEIASMQTQLASIETTSRDVYPLMEKMVTTLEQFVSLDIPFRIEERNKRVATLKGLMDRADVTVSEKYRRILEAYQIEMEYGRTLDNYEMKLGEGDDRVAGQRRTPRQSRAVVSPPRRQRRRLLGQGREEVGLRSRYPEGRRARPEALRRSKARPSCCGSPCQPRRRCNRDSRSQHVHATTRRVALLTAALLGLQLAVPMNASAAAAAVTLDQLLQQVKNTRAAEGEQNAQRLKDFTANRAQQASVLAEAERAQAAAEARSKALSTEFDNNEKEINEVTTLLQAARRQPRRIVRRNASGRGRYRERDGAVDHQRAVPGSRRVPAVARQREDTTFY